MFHKGPEGNAFLGVMFGGDELAKAHSFCDLSCEAPDKSMKRNERFWADYFRTPERRRRSPRCGGEAEQDRDGEVRIGVCAGALGWEF